jgi:diacylglycerol kinase family enzyme
MGGNDVCVIFNAAAGRGRAARLLAQLRRHLGRRVDFRPTRGPGHGVELAAAASRSGFAVVGAAGGDGTVHEVANGLLEAERRDVVMAVYPIGSANDYAASLGLDAGWWQHPDASVGVRAVDVGLITAPGGRRRYFVNGVGLGFNGAVTRESRRIRCLRGLALYGCAVLRALWFHFDHPVMTIAFDDQVRTTPTLALTVSLGRREGSFPLTPQAELDDGLFDYVHAGALKRWEVVRYLPQMATGRLPANHPSLWLGRCKTVRVTSPSPLTVHTDGEFFCLPEDDIRELEIRLLPRIFPVQGRWPAGATSAAPVG